LCHPEPPTRFQRVKRALNQRHRWCCKPGPPASPRRTRFTAGGLSPRKAQKPVSLCYAQRAVSYFGVDLTAIPSLNALTAYTLLAEVGTDGSKFRNIHAFASWACFCPHNKKSGGKVLSAKTRRSANRVNRALRLAAQTL